MMQDAVFVDFCRRKLGNMPGRREGNPPEMLQDAVSMDFRRWNSRIYQNSGREIHLKCSRMPFPWISVGGNSGIYQNSGREIHLE